MAKQKEKQSHQVSIYNKSAQTLGIETCPPNGDFFLHRQQIQLLPKKHVQLPKSYLNKKQIENLQKKGFIKIIYDSEARQNQANV